MILFVFNYVVLDCFILLMNYLVEIIMLNLIYLVVELDLMADFFYFPRLNTVSLYDLKTINSIKYKFFALHNLK